MSSRTWVSLSIIERRNLATFDAGIAPSVRTVWLLSAPIAAAYDVAVPIDQPPIRSPTARSRVVGR